MKKRVGIFAASSIVPVAEFNLGMVILKEQGFEVTVHPQVLAKHYMYPGTDEARATALYDFACDDKTEILWSARGGYGASRLMPMLDRLTRERGKPKRKKLIIGYSDVTVLHEFARRHWGFSTLHASMPAGLSFAQMIPAESAAMFACAHGEKTAFPWEKAKMSFIGAPPKSAISGEIVGGNLSLWQCVVGTPYAGDAREKSCSWKMSMSGRIASIECFNKSNNPAGSTVCARSCSAISRIATTKAAPASSRWRPVKIRASSWRMSISAERIPLRREYSLDEAAVEIFEEVGKRRNIPIAPACPWATGRIMLRCRLGRSTR